MRMIRLVLILLLASYLYAWTNYTNVFIAKEVLLEKYPMCSAEIEEGVMEVIKNEVSDPYLGEPVNLHCDAASCPAYDSKYCQMIERTCKSEVKAGEVQGMARKLCNCEQAKVLASAITYFVSKYDYMNLMVNESKECREGFDNAVEEGIKSGNKTWSVSYKCDRPNREFTFTSQKMQEVILSAKQFAFTEAYVGSNAWYCYKLGQGGASNQVIKKKIGELCKSDSECESGNCNNNVCCAEGRCCPVPGMKGSPCERGEKCSAEYECVPINAKNGEKCEYDEECASMHCAQGSARPQPKYCCSKEGSYCCASSADCASGEECISNVCKPLNTGVNVSNNAGEENKKDEKCLPIIILSAVGGALYVLYGRVGGM